MLVSKPLEPLLHQQLITVEPVGNALPVSTLLSRVSERYPNGNVTLYLPPMVEDQSARFSVIATEPDHAAHHGHNPPSTTVYVNPYSGEILGTIDPSKTLYVWFKNFHGTLFLGDLGDSIIEIAAGLSVLMLITGLYLALLSKNWKRVVNHQPASSRERWREFHRLLGLVIAIPLLFFLISGLAWTNVWGGQLVQPWSSLPGTKYVAAQDERSHQSMHHEGINPIPWALEQTPMPISGSMTSDSELGLDELVAISKEQGFRAYRVHLPQGSSGVWTISATTIAGDVINPFDERVLHLDQFSGEVLAESVFSDYPMMGKAMAAFIPLHQGDLGLWNWLLNIILVILVMFLIALGGMLWWKRRPTKAFRLAPPIATPSVSKKVIAVMFVVACCFPLSAIVLALVILFDYLVVSRFGGLRRVMK